MGTVQMNPLLFPKSKQGFSDVLFEEPTSEYRGECLAFEYRRLCPQSNRTGAPFWSWNTKLEPKKLVKQIGQLKEMGMGG
jgi:hypothetical protein